MYSPTRGHSGRAGAGRNKPGSFRFRAKNGSQAAPSSGGSRGFRRSNTPRNQRGGRKMPTFDVSRFINKNPSVQEDTPVYAPVNTFESFGLSPALLGGIAQARLVAPTQIQDEAIPHILAKRDVVGLANTGTGKTAAFLIPLIELTAREHYRSTLILTPTRELAIQVHQELRMLSGKMRLYSTVCVGGVNIRPQIMSLRRKNQFVIGTPGRILDLIQRGEISPESFSTVVLDEADRMLDMGFIHDIKKILSRTPEKRETQFFSATMTPVIEGLIRTFSHDPITVSVRKRDITTNIEQDVVRAGERPKHDVLAELLNREGMARVIVFVAMKHSAERLKKQLLSRGISADSIQGNKSHSQRQRALKQFKENQVRVLVATDVAARGIHIDTVSHVINFDLPSCYEDYVHRIGRTGRGVHRGKALTFV